MHVSLFDYAFCIFSEYIDIHDWWLTKLMYYYPTKSTSSFVRICRWTICTGRLLQPNAIGSPVLYFLYVCFRFFHSLYQRFSFLNWSKTLYLSSIHWPDWLRVILLLHWRFTSRYFSQTCKFDGTWMCRQLKLWISVGHSCHRSVMFFCA